MKHHALFLNILLIGVFSFSLLTPEDVFGVTPSARMPAIDTTTALPPLLNITAIAAGQYHTCALTSGGRVKCWGWNYYGQLGDSTTFERHWPVNVNEMASVVSAIAAGGSHTCALTVGGGVKCWGYNEYGQLGDGTTFDRNTPVNVSGLESGVSAITTGTVNTCALTTAGGAKCWGYNGYGQLGDGTTTTHSTPVDVSGLSSGVTAITTGGYHTCALTETGGVKCWGYNASGQLGDGTTTQRLTPVDVSGLASGASAITAGVSHTCARTAGGGAKCWGNNEYGQLGDGWKTNRYTPVDVNGLTSGVSGIRAGYYHTCARTAGGGVKCWGDNGSGQLGNGTTTTRLRPVDVSGLASGVSGIRAGFWHTCARTTEGGVKCWGNNVYGQLGDGTTTTRLTPVDVVEPPTILYRSTGSQDGWVLEFSQTSYTGGTMNSAATVFRLGDDAQDRQYRAILSFDTSGLPDDAVIIKVKLKIKKQGLVGTDPFTTHKNLKVDIRKGGFSGNKALQLIDFQAAASKRAAGTVIPTSSGGWFPVIFNSSASPYINLTGVTQFRLRFAIHDNNDHGADYLKFYSGDYGTVVDRPVLVIQYYVP